MPTPVIDFAKDDRIQSPYLYVQAAGSDAADGSTSGVHLRWLLRNELGDSHLPKGNLTSATGPYPSAEGFNKENDFVSVYRVPYSIKYPAVINLKKDKPARLTEKPGQTRAWEFDVTVKTIIAQTVTTTLILRFKDTAQYDALRSGMNPLTTDTLEFISAYAGVVEIEAKDKISFATTFHMRALDPENTPPGVLRTEAISLPDRSDEDSIFISCREQFTDTYTPPVIGDPSLPLVHNTAFLKPVNCHEHKIMVENIKYVRFQYENYYPGEIIVETYEDFFTGANLHETINWQGLGSYSLSLDDTEVFSRLDNSSFNVNGNWPKFNDRNTPQTGAFTVKTQNYIDRWTLDKGLKSGLQTYLQASMDGTNPMGITIEPVDNTGQSYNPANEAQTELNHLNLLQVISLDFHVARMLGLGHIDTNLVGEQKFIYLSVYDTAVPIVSGAPSAVKHFYMTLPTGRADKRLPEAPVLKNLTYGLEIPSFPKPRRVTDALGYVPFENKRYISLYRKINEIARSYSDTFFASPELFCIEEITDTVFLGVEYKLSSESIWRAPELSSEPPVLPGNTPAFTDPAGIAEVITLMAVDNETTPVYVHEETEPGRHMYALYAINWFSRTSATGNNVETDVTVFPKINNLLPPSKFAVQLIQKENPLMFTTAFEQDKLNGINTNKQEILVRAEFSWNHVQISAYQLRTPSPIRLANTAQLFFRSTPPNTVQGKVTAVVDIDDETIEVTAGSYSIYSSTSNPAGELITPVIANADKTKFVAALFVSGEKSYLVQSVSQITPVIKFVLKKIVDVTNDNTGSSDSLTTRSIQNFTSPEVNDIFAVVENLSADTSWPNCKLAKEVQLINFETTLDETGATIPSRTHQETVTEKDGTSKLKILGGLFGKAEIEPVLETIPDPGYPGPTPPNILDPNHPNPFMTVPVPGAYIISFNTLQLANHPDSEVQWVKGTVRIEAVAPAFEGKKLLEVVSIDRSLATLKLLVFDATAGDDDYTPIKTGTDVLVNYHPGYRAYFVQDSIAHFDKPTILPAPGELSRETYMAIRSKDSTEPLESPIATPVILYAREINDPVPPGIPMGPQFATRPDFYGKSTYTFDTLVNTDNGRQPFSLVFYRANERKILDELYKPETVAAILTALAGLTPADAAFNNSRWYDLVHGDYGMIGTNPLGARVGNAFNQYVPGGYRFPTPDNDQYKVQDENDPNSAYIYPLAHGTEPGLIMDRVLEAIAGCFLPLTEQQLFYRDIPFGYQTSGRKPKLYNSNGDRLLPGNADYDPNPMAVKFVDGNNKMNVRFTDYSLDGPSTSIYFYYGQELSNDMSFSAAGPIAGPIRMVNSSPAQPPQIRKFTTQLDNPITGDVAAVLFEINSYIPSEQITKIRIYRALNMDDARSIRTMKLAKDVTITNTGAEVWTLMDDFADVDFPLFGETLFYRLVAVRTISNEKNELEDVPSLESELVLGSIVDVFNPPAPELSYHAGNLTSITPATLPGVKLKWNKVAHNATYYLYQMNSTGNWQLLKKIKSNDQNLFYKPSTDLVKEDEDGNTIYYRYKVDVENASGLLNLEEKALVI